MYAGPVDMHLQGFQRLRFDNFFFTVHTGILKTDFQLDAGIPCFFKDVPVVWPS